MLAQNHFNRSKISEYLDNISEDDLIEQIIIPLFNQNGYLLYRKNIHGPGEHGKDLIFYRHVKLFFDNEYVVVQAKAEKVTASNVTKFADQLTRALKVPFPGKSRGQVHANYVMFINSKIHTNDANFEFHYLADMKDNIKILSQENLIELILEGNIVPIPLKNKLEEYQAKTQSFSEDIRSIIFENDNLRINKLLDRDLKIENRQLDDDVKGLIINYIFHKWSEDPSWDGIVKPMQWLLDYFDYIQSDQNKKLIRVLEEYTSSYPSFDAQINTAKVVKKITAEQLSAFQSEFLKLYVTHARAHDLSKFPLLEDKFRLLLDSDLVENKFKSVVEVLQKQENAIENIKRQPTNELKEPFRQELLEAESQLYYFLYPEDKEK